MLRDFSVTPKAKNKNAITLMSAFFAISLISLIVTLFLEKYKGVVGLVTFASLITAILVYTKYVSVVFHYDIIAEGVDEPLFVVRQTVGRRNETLCRISLLNVTSIKKETAEERRTHKTPAGVAKYVYTPTLFPSENYRISVFSRKQKAEIIVEISDEFANALTEMVSEARLLMPSEDDE